MTDKFKKDLLFGYEKLVNSQSGIIYREVNKENGYEENIEKDGGDIVINYLQFNDSYTVFAAITELMNFVKDFSLLFSKDLYSLKAFTYLFDYLEKYIKKYPRWVYREEDSLEKYMVYYGLDDKNMINYSKILNSTIQLTVDSPYQNITDEYKKLSSDGVYFGTLIDNKIVSIAGTNGMKNEIVDIGVGTYKDYRHKGYANSNVAALSDYLVNIGRVVKYSCNNLNIFSNKIAASSGFKIIAKEKTIWCPLNEEGSEI